MKINLFILPLIATSVVMCSCVKNPETPQPDSSQSDPGTVKEMTVPAGFDWKMSRSITCNFTSEHQTRVYVSLPAGAEPFAALLAGGDAEPVTLSVPVSVKSLYVKYEKTDGTFVSTELSAAGATLSYAVPADSKEYVESTVASAGTAVRAVRAARAQDDKGHILYPAAGWGTLMFEDLWPSYGDYDFNDLVVNYQIDLMPQNKNKLREMLIGIRVQAIGGTIPYDFYLSLRTVRPSEIATIERIRNFNGVASNNMVLVNADDNSSMAPAIFKFTDIKQNVNKPGVPTFLNVRPGDGMKAEDMTEAWFLVSFQSATSPGKLPFDSFDFFIGNESQRKEIHLAGFEPVLYGADRYESLRKQPTSNANKQSEYYYSNDNLVWGINVPAEIPHAYEARDFLTAYPNFAKWAQSGGVSNTDWYTHAPGNRNSENLVLMK